MTHFKPRTYCALFVLCALLIGLLWMYLGRQDRPQNGLATPSETAVPEKASAPSDDELQQNIDREHLVGWYKMTGPRDTLIPVFKIDGTYYSVCFGVEIPLKECPEGLEWALTPSSMTGTKIGFDEETNDYYIVIKNRLRAAFEDTPVGSKLGEKTPITRIEKPSGLLDATAQAPSTNDDFLGWYQAVWFPMRSEIRKDGEKYLVAGQLYDGSDFWRTDGEPAELTPLPDRLGFFIAQSKDQRTSITYNDALKRFELTTYQLDGKRQQAIIRMPVARIQPPSSEAAAVPHMNIGIPSWH